MAAKFSTGLRSKLLNGPGLISALQGARLRVFCAASDPAHADTTRVDVPATADAAEAGTLMLECTIGGDGVTGATFVDGGAGIAKLAAGQTLIAPAGLADGPIHYWRLVLDTDTHGESDTDVRVQGTVGLVTGEMLVTDVNIQAGAAWSLNHCSVEIPAEGA